MAGGAARPVGTSPIQRPFRSGGFQSSQALPAAGAVRCLSSAAAAAAGTAVDAPPAAAACWPLAARFNPRCAVPSHPIHPIRDRWIAPPACGSRHTPAPGLEPVISPVPAHPANSLLLFSPPLLPCASTSLPPVRVTRTSTLVPSPRLQPLLDVFAVAFWPLQIFIGRRVRCVVRVVSCPVFPCRAVQCSQRSCRAERDRLARPSSPTRKHRELSEQPALSTTVRLTTDVDDDKDDARERESPQPPRPSRTGDRHTTRALTPSSPLHSLPTVPPCRLRGLLVSSNFMPRVSLSRLFRQIRLVSGRCN